MDGVIRHVTFRVEHDCPLAGLSQQIAGDVLVWSGHRFEVVVVPVTAATSGDERGRVRAAVAAALEPEHVYDVPDGVVAVWRPTVDPKSSISRILETHGLLWQQPLRVRGGWEHYDAIAFGGNDQDALDALRAKHTTHVVRRRDIGAGDVTASLFMSLAPALDAPTSKQAEALLQAADMGYYQTPRGTTTAIVAAAMAISRSSFEERLRACENRIMAEVVPAMRWHRQDAG